jgi:hypothetical protein
VCSLAELTVRASGIPDPLGLDYRLDTHAQAMPRVGVGARDRVCGEIWSVRGDDERPLVALLSRGDADSIRGMLIVPPRTRP